MDDEKVIGSGELIFREEGGWWGAYFKSDILPGGMMALGSIRWEFVEADENLKVGFVLVMHASVVHLVEKLTGTTCVDAGEIPTSRTLQ